MNSSIAWKSIFGRLIATTAIATALVVFEVPASAGGVAVVQTNDASVLSNALGGSGVTILGGSILNGDPAQFGTYSNFNQPPITIGNGIVMSSGIATQVMLPPDPSLPGPQPSNDMGISGTSEFNTYGSAHIQGFNGSYDVAALQVNFSLAAASQVQFSFVFGSVEFPFWTNQFPDSLLAFLDPTKDQLANGTANQVVFDKNGNPVQVGSSFAGLVSTSDKNTTFSNPHGLLGLTTTTASLSAGVHSLLFEVGDVNDHILDSAAFISNLHVVSSGTTVGTEITDPNSGDYHKYNPVPEPSSLALLLLGGIGVVFRTTGRGFFTTRRTTT
jgi:hypothetical protein